MCVLPCSYQNHTCFNDAALLYNAYFELEKNVSPAAKKSYEKLNENIRSERAFGYYLDGLTSTSNLNQIENTDIDVKVMLGIMTKPVILEPIR